MTTGKLARVGVGFLGETNQVEDAAARDGPFGGSNPAERERELDVGRDAEPRKEGRLLEDEGEVGGGGIRSTNLSSTSVRAVMTTMFAFMLRTALAQSNTNGGR